MKTLQISNMSEDKKKFQTMAETKMHAIISTKLVNFENNFRF